MKNTIISHYQKYSRHIVALMNQRNHSKRDKNIIPVEKSTKDLRYPQMETTETRALSSRLPTSPISTFALTSIHQIYL